MSISLKNSGDLVSKFLDLGLMDTGGGSSSPGRFIKSCIRAFILAYASALLFCGACLSKHPPKHHQKEPTSTISADAANSSKSEPCNLL